MVQPGKMDRRITVQARTSLNTGGSVALSYSDKAVVSAEIVNTTSREFRSAGSLRDGATIAFRIWYLPTLTSTDRILYAGKRYNVVGDPIEEGRKETMLVQAQYVEGRA
jgi:SPP1 family predicted phage head-tail adaptor